jgi:hypothetical protein
LGFFPFFFGTYGRNWSYMTSQKNWCVKSLGNSIFKYHIFTFIWSYHNLDTSCYINWIQKASWITTQQLSNYQKNFLLTSRNHTIIDVHNETNATYHLNELEQFNMLQKERTRLINFRKNIWSCL